MQLRSGEMPDDTPSPEDAMKNEDAIEAVEQCDRILRDCEDVPERGEDFASSIMEKVESIRDWIVKHDNVTEKQLDSLDNMESAVGRWIN